MQGETTINVIRPDLAEPVRAKPAPFGLGDAVAVVAQPIARILKLEGCGACAKRKAILNSILPDVRHPLKH